MNNQELIAILSQVSKGLLWPSESDYPFETVYIEHVEDIKFKLLEITNYNAQTTIEIKELDEFFGKVTQEEDWYEKEEIAESKRYQGLVKLLRTYLTDVKVYRLGNCEIKVYILGKTKSGAYLGLSTISVET